MRDFINQMISDVTGFIDFVFFDPYAPIIGVIGFSVIFIITKLEEKGIIGQIAEWEIQWISNKEVLINKKNVKLFEFDRYMEASLYKDVKDLYSFFSKGYQNFSIDIDTQIYLPQKPAIELEANPLFRGWEETIELSTQGYSYWPFLLTKQEKATIYRLNEGSSLDFSALNLEEITRLRQYVDTEIYFTLKYFFIDEILTLNPFF